MCICNICRKYGVNSRSDKQGHRPQAQLCQHPNLFGKQDKVTLEGVTKDREREVDYVTDYGIFLNERNRACVTSMW